MPSLLPGVDLDALADQDDCARRVLGECVVPRSVDELAAILAAYTTSGMSTRLPTHPGTGGVHSETCDVAKIVTDAEAGGWLHRISGKSTWVEIAEHTDALKTTLSHDYPTDDGGRYNRVLDWAEGDDRAAWDPTADHYALTHAGFEALTGHKQGERPEAPPEVVDPADIQPASIGDA